MSKVNPRILTINGGSTSIKFAMFDSGDSLKRLYSGKIERIGSVESKLHIKSNSTADQQSILVKAPDYESAASVVIDWIKHDGRSDALAAVGHRIVNGGPRFFNPQRVSPELFDELRRLSPFDPEHLPAEIMLAEKFHQSFSNVPQFACFDTAFHHNLPRVAQLLPIPRRYESQGIRRYGFHGLSYEFLMRRLTQLVGTEAANGRIILAHLGGGASLAAVHRGLPVETSMGFTPTSGVSMSTRSGDLDPGLVCYLMKAETLSPEQMRDLFTFQSGLLGVSETSSDMRDLLKFENNDVRAAEAIALFCYQIKKTIGAFATAIGGLDTLVFSGGIGENSPQVRHRVCDGLGFLGIELAENQNEANGPVISTNSSQVDVRVIPTDEEWMIANTVYRMRGEELDQKQESFST